MSKRSSNNSSLLSLGVKRIRRGGNEGENGPAQSASQQPTDVNDRPDQDDTDAVDAITECSSDCCKPDREGPNQPTSSQILAATKRVQSRQARYVQAQWFRQHPWLTLCDL